MIRFLVLLTIALTGVYSQKINMSNSSNMTTVMPKPIIVTRPTIKPIVLCQVGKYIKGCVKPPPKPDPFKGLNQDVVKTVTGILLLKGSKDIKNETYVADQASSTDSYKKFMTLVDSVQMADLKKMCQIADPLRNFLESELALASKEARESLATVARYSRTLYCKKDCNFGTYLKIKPNDKSSLMKLYNDSLKLAKFVMPLLNPNAQKQCRYTIAKNMPKPASANDIKSDLSSVNLLTPSELGNFSKADSLEIAKSLATGGKKLDKKATKNLAKNIPKTANAKDLLSLASSIPIECFNNTKPGELVDNLARMDLENMSKFRKAFIAKKIVSSGTKAEVEKFLKSNNDKTMKNVITAKMIEDLNIDISTIPVGNLPKSTLKRYANKMLKDKTLDKITDITVLSKVLKGVKKSSLKALPKDKVISSIVNMMNASIQSGDSLNSNQRRFMREDLIKALIAKNGSNPADYLKTFTTEEVKLLYPLFIEADSKILTAFSQLDNFQSMAAAAVSMPSGDCCKYLRSSRQLFTKFVIPTVTTNEILTYADLLALGNCFASTIPIEKLKSMNSTDFLNFYPTIGKTFQPDSSETSLVKSKITEAGSGKDQDTFVFTTLSDLALFYPSYSNLNKTNLKTNGAGLVEKIKTTRDTKDVDVQMCRIGLSNTDVDKMFSGIGDKFVEAYIASLTARRRRRSVQSLTCNDINNMAGSLNSIPSENLATLTTTEFTSCMSVLGAASNYWTSSQLSTLATLTKNKYTSINSILDADIASLNSILYGFSSAELAQLNFTATDGVAALGALTDWTSSQLTSGLRTPIKNYLAFDGQNITADDISVMNNLVCTLDTDTTDKVTDTIFVDSVSTLSKLSVNCPNIGVWYAKAKASPTYGAYIYNNTVAISELGAIMGGITTADLALVSGEDISSLDSSVWDIMPPSTVNSLSSSQLTGLSAAQVNSIQNSPNYAQFSGGIKNAASSLSAGGSGVVAAETSASNTLGFSAFTMILSTMAALFSFSVKF